MVTHTIGQAANIASKQASRQAQPQGWAIGHYRRLSRLLLSVSLGSLTSLAGASALSASPQAASTTPPSPSVEVAQAAQSSAATSLPINCATSTEKSLSFDGMYLPTLWWVREQYAAKPGFGAQLIRSWTTKPDSARTQCQIDVIVNRQLWSLLDYLERYEFVNQVGFELVNQLTDSVKPVVRNHRYTVRVFDRTPRNAQEANQPVATYRCVVRSALPLFPSLDFSEPMTCRIGPDGFNNSGLSASILGE